MNYQNIRTSEPGFFGAKEGGRKQSCENNYIHQEDGGDNLGDEKINFFGQKEDSQHIKSLSFNNSSSATFLNNNDEYGDDKYDIKECSFADISHIKQNTSDENQIHECHQNTTYNQAKALEPEDASHQKKFSNKQD